MENERNDKYETSGEEYARLKKESSCTCGLACDIRVMGDPEKNDSEINT